jgi:hypothetical protein
MIKTKNLCLTIVLGGALMSTAFADTPSDDFDPNAFTVQQINTIATEQAGFDLIANGSIEKLEACLKKHFDGNDCEIASAGHGGDQSENPFQGTHSFNNSVATPAPTPQAIQNTAPQETTQSKSSGSTQLPIASSNSNSSGWHYKL